MKDVVAIVLELSVAAGEDTNVAVAGNDDRPVTFKLDEESEAALTELACTFT